MGRPKITNPVIDTVSLARRVLNTRVANLDYLCRRFKVDLSERGLHGALLDSQLLAEVYLELRGGKQFSMDLLKKNNTKNVHTKLKKPNNNIFVKLKASEADIKNHKKMLDEIKQPLWKKYNY